jgi:CMP-N-acetylneuraminic acid synthetase
MADKPYILGIIPARGGSKGVPRKNIRPIAGKPLIAWTIEAAKASRLLDRCVVSTEDAEIAAVSRSFGSEVLERPAELATDEASTLGVLRHAVEKIPCDIVVLLQATSPIRSKGLIDECIKEFIDKGYDSLATGFICKYMEYAKDVEVSSDGKELRRQDIPGFFYDDGNVYIMKADLIRKNERYGRNIGRKFISRWENHEIDDQFDFWVAEKILAEGRY